MAKCENCGADITDKMKFCSECGTRIPTDKECPECHTRCALAAKFCSECGHDFSKPVEDNAEDFDGDNDDNEEASPGGHYSVRLKDLSDSDKGAVLRDLVEITGMGLMAINNMLKKLPVVIAEGVSRDEADKYALVLKIDGAEAEVVADEDGDDDEDDDDEECDDNDEGDDEGAEDEEEDEGDEIGPSQTGLYSVVVKSWGNGRTKPCDNLRIEFNCNLLQGMGYDEFNGLLSTPVPFTLVKRISRERAELFAVALREYDCEFEIVAVEPIPEGAIDFDRISDFIKKFKRTSQCDDIVLPNAASFDKKWTNLSGVLESWIDDLSLDPDDAIAILDCTVFGSAKNGVLIDKTGIYTNNDNDEICGWMDWDLFKTSGHITKNGSYDVHLLDDPLVGINVTGCGLSTVKTIKFFKELLSLVRGEG